MLLFIIYSTDTLVSLFVAASCNYKSFAIVLDAPTLRRLATTKPVSMDELTNIEGVADTKAKKFGDRLLEVTTKYAAMSMSSLPSFYECIL